MATFELILLLFCAVIVSAVLEKVLPKISIPLVQIGLGVLITIFARKTMNVTLNPEFFLVLFIAPLLFYEARLSDKHGLWENKRVILSLAIGLVIAIILSVGFSIHFLIPSIPLAAAFALGAALGPTDAVAVSSLSETAQLDRHVSARLSGEALLNDASGVVGFEFAIAAVATGSFSVLNGVATFSLDFFGGIVIGLVLGVLSHLIFKFVDDFDMGSNVFYVLFDVTMPFIVFLAAEIAHVSGILAVVSAGILISILNTKKINPAQSSLNIVTDNVWKVISFALNGIVFVLLGMQLPKAVLSTWNDESISNLHLIGYILIITVILVVVRFLWICIMDSILKDKTTNQHTKISKAVAKNALIATIGGPKGAVTLSVIMSIPLLIDGSPFPQRQLIIFLASGTILLTLALANFLLPILAPAKKIENGDMKLLEAQACIDILRNVIDKLNTTRTKENHLAVDAVAAAYASRIETMQNRNDIQIESSRKLRIETLNHLQHFVMEKIDSNQTDPMIGYMYLHRLAQQMGYLKHHIESPFWFLYALRHGNTTVLALKRYLRRIFERTMIDEGKSNLTILQIEGEHEAIRLLQSYIDNPESPYPPEVITDVLSDYQRTLKSLKTKGPSVTAFTKSIDAMEDIQRSAYYLELQEIKEAADENRIRRSTAIEMRDDVYLMLIDLDTSMA